MGATFVGPDGAEPLHAATVAAVGRVPLSTLWHAVPADPTLSEVWLRLLDARPDPLSRRHQGPGPSDPTLVTGAWPVRTQVPSRSRSLQRAWKSTEGAQQPLREYRDHTPTGGECMAETGAGRASTRRGIRVVLVDDHELVRRGLREVLADAGGISVVGEAGTLIEGLRRISSQHPDVVLTEVRLPDGSGIDLLRQVRQSHPAVRVVCVSSVDDPQAVHTAILAGACGYLLKEIRGTALAEAVRRVAAGQSLLDPAVTEQVFERLRNPEAVHPALAALTPQERRILELIVDGHTNREIGAELNVSEQTVKNHVTNLLAKLKVTRRTQAAVLGARLRGANIDHYE